MRKIILFLFKSFWLSKSKLFLCVLSAVVSAAGISSVVYSFILSERDFKENFLRTNPVDIVLSLKNPSADVINTVKQNKKIAAIERRESVSGRIKNKNGNWMPLTLFGVENINLPAISKFTIQESRPADSSWVFIEKSCKIFTPPVGQNLEMEFSDNIISKYFNKGTVHDPGLPPGPMEQSVYGYTSLENSQLYLKDSNQRFLIKTNIVNPDFKTLQSVTTELSNLIKSKGGTVSGISIPPPGEHPHQSIVDGISFLLKTFGVVLAILGIILLSLILITWLYPQISNIGVMKTLGGSTRDILTGYFVVLLLLVMIGLIGGLPLGYRVAKFYSGVIAALQNFTPIKEPLPAKPHLIVVFLSVVLPFSMGAFPLIKASRISVQNALTNVFYTPHKGIFKITQPVIRNSFTKYGFNNLFRSSTRTFLMGLLLAIGIGLFLSGSNLKYSIKKDFKSISKDSYYNVTVNFNDSLSGNLPFIEKLPFVESVSYISRVSGSFKLPGQTFPENSAIKILSPDYVMGDSLLIAGKLDKNCRECIYIGMKYQADFADVKLGDKILFKSKGIEKEYTFSGVVKDMSSHPPAIYNFSRHGNENYREIAIKVKDDYSLEKAKQEIDDTFLDNDIDIKSISDSETKMIGLINHLGPTHKIIKITGILTLIVGLLGMLIAISLSLNERIRETGIMKALGGTVRKISTLILIEYFIISIISIAAGIAMSYFFTMVIGNTLGTLVLGTPILPKFDKTFLIISALVLLLFISFMVSAFSYYKIKQSSTKKLLSQLF